MSNAIYYKGVSYAEDNAIRSPGGTLYEAKELRADALEADSLQLTVRSASGTIQSFTLNDKVEYYRDGTLRGIYYLQSVTRVGPDVYEIYALSTVGRLMVQPHVGGIYTGQTAEAVAREICGDLPVRVESAYASRGVYGWLPYADGETRSARDNLADLLLYLGAWLSTDNNGTLHITKLWDGINTVIPAGRVDSRNARETTDAPISAITVTAHQYTLGTEDVTLYTGTAEADTLVIFDEPAHALSATGFEILESGANYAILSAGTGELTGKSYVHTTHTVRRTVTPGAPENEIPVSDCTLISVLSASDVAGRLADYYSCRATLTVDVNPHGERAGHVVMLEHPWDHHLVQACIASRETKVSGLLKSRTTALVGYLPPQPDISEYYDTMEILTGAGKWTIPAGVTSYTRVLIGAAQGGRAGRKGADAASGQSFSDGDYRGYTLALGGAGGEGGAPGAGGKVLVENITGVSAGDKVAYSCGAGGEGSTDPDTDGSPGTATTMGDASSASGASSDAGYADPITGKIYAALGLQGLPGGDGAGRDPSVTDFDADTVRQFVPAGSAQDEDSNTYAGGDTPEDTPGSSRVPYTMARLDMGRATYSQGLGGGAAAGAAGTSGTDGRIGAGTTSSTRTVYAGAGADGASAAKTPRKPTLYGQGGRGGYGGGGGGSCGFNASNASAISVDRGVGGVGGLGSLGGPGADGCIILYYRKYAPKRAGWVREKNRLWLIDRLGRRVIV